MQRRSMGRWALGTLWWMGLFPAWCGQAEKAGAAQPQTISYEDFADLSAFTLNGSAAEINVDQQGVSHQGRRVLRLTTNEGWQGGSAFLTRPIPLTNQASFSTAFQFEMHQPGGIEDSDGVGADGLAFVVQTQANNVGGAGFGIGYEGIEPSVAVEFDAFDNEALGENGDVSGNHVGINLNGDTRSVAQVPLEKRLNDGGVWFAWVDYDGPKHLLEVRLSDQAKRPDQPLLRHEVNLAELLGSPEVYVGFTASTGEAYNCHDIRSWKFVNTFQPTPGEETSPPASLDELHLRGGKVHRGTFLSFNGTILRFRTEDGKVLEVPRAEVKSVVLGEVPGEETTE